MQSVDRVLAIDGPSGSGKSTVALLVAAKIHGLYVDTGAMFRAVAYALNGKGIALDDEAQVTNVLPSMKMEYGSGVALVKINGEDLTEKIRQHQVSAWASLVSKLPVVRNYLLDAQRSLVKQRLCLMEGRDIGTVVFPKAFCKIYLTASLEVRAERRLKDLQAKGDHSITLKQLMEDMAQRDHQDSTRAVAPLRQAEDATLVDSSSLAVEDVVNQIVDVANLKAKEANFQL